MNPIKLMAEKIYLDLEEAYSCISVPKTYAIRQIYKSLGEMIESLSVSTSTPIYFLENLNSMGKLDDYEEHRKGHESSELGRGLNKKHKIESSARFGDIETETVTVFVVKANELRKENKNV